CPHGYASFYGADRPHGWRKRNHRTPAAGRRWRSGTACFSRFSGVSGNLTGGCRENRISVYAGRSGRVLCAEVERPGTLCESANRGGGGRNSVSLQLIAGKTELRPAYRAHERDLGNHPGFCFAEYPVFHLHVLCHYLTTQGNESEKYIHGGKCGICAFGGYGKRQYFIFCQQNPPSAVGAGKAFFPDANERVFTFPPSYAYTGFYLDLWFGYRTGECG